MLTDNKGINQSNQDHSTRFLPDINMNDPYHSKGWSDNQFIYNSKIQELINKKFEDKPINNAAIMNKHLKNHLRGNLFLNQCLLGNKELKTPLSHVAENLELQSDSDFTQDKDSSKAVILPIIQLKENINKNEYSIAKELESKINQLAKLYETENFKNKYVTKDTLKILCPLKSSEKFKKESYQANSLKINNMLNPYKHSEYSPDNKTHNMLKDKFKKHAEELLRFKHLERNENKRMK